MSHEIYTSKTVGDGPNLTIYQRDIDDLPSASFTYRCGYSSGPIRDIDDLLEVVQRHRPNNLDNLPTFGGDEPNDTTEVWSWDENWLLVGTCAANLEIVERASANIDADDIQKLRDEAAAAGDHAQVDVCDRALAGDYDAWNECCDVIADACAQIDG